MEDNEYKAQFAVKICNVSMQKICVLQIGMRLATCCLLRTRRKGVAGNEMHGAAEAA